MHIHSDTQTHIHSAIQNLEIAIRHLVKADKEYLVSEVVKSLQESGTAVPADYKRVIGDASEQEGNYNVLRAINEIESALKDAKKCLREPLKNGN